jgi:transposase, IS5 family
MLSFAGGQYITGESSLQTQLPMNPSSLTRWMQRIGEEGMEAACAAGLIKRRA